MATGTYFYCKCMTDDWLFKRQFLGHECAPDNDFWWITLSGIWNHGGLFYMQHLSITYPFFRHLNGSNSGTGFSLVQIEKWRHMTSILGTTMVVPINHIILILWMGQRNPAPPKGWLKHVETRLILGCLPSTGAAQWNEKTAVIGSGSSYSRWGHHPLVPWWDTNVIRYTMGGPAKSESPVDRW